MREAKADILIIGGGPAGLAAAVSASSDGKASVMLVDENPRMGGQIWRAEQGRTRSTEALRLMDPIRDGAVKMMNDSRIIAAEADGRLAAVTPSGRVAIEYGKLIIATGARELFLPFPGWTHPSVAGAGGLQALVKGGLNVTGEKIVIAGTGPLLLAVAEYLRSKGATIAAIVEQAPAAAMNRFALGLWRSPAKLFQAALLRARLAGVPYLTGAWVTAANGREKLGSVSVNAGGKAMTIECDRLACGFHLVPNTELAELLGCGIANGSVAVDDLQRTSLASVFCAGEPAGIGGVETAKVEGSIAGHAAAGRENAARKLFAKRDRSRRFANAMNDAFSLRPELRGLAGETTIVCRCEDVQYGRFKDHANWRAAKLQTRCGMGPCQGRICGAATRFLFGWEPDSVRPPLTPVKLENL